MLRPFLEDACVGLTQRRLEEREHLLGFGSVRLKEPPERIEREVLDRTDGQGAGVLAGLVPSHAVSDEKQMSALVAELRSWFWEARLPDAHRLAELGDEELILVGGAHAALVGEPEGLHRQRTVLNLCDGLVVCRHG